MKEKRNRKQFHLFLPLCMAALVLLLDVLFFVLPDRSLSETENRNLQQLPALTWDSVTQGRFESQFDDYIADQFPGRDSWIAAETTIQRLAGNTGSHDIFLGKNGYLIQAFSNPSEEEYREILDGFGKIAKGHPDIRQYALIAPTAISVLKEYLPANAAAVGGDEEAFLDRLYEDLQGMGIIPVDVRETLKNLKASGVSVYYRTDHHWTTDAAYAAYQTFLNRAELEDPGITYQRLLVTDQFQGTLTASSGFRVLETDEIYVYLPENDREMDGTREGSPQEDGLQYTITNLDTGEKRASFYETSYLDTRDKYAMFLGGNHGELKIQTTAVSERKLLVVKDSYANCMIPFLAGNFRTVLVIDPRYFTGDISQVITDEEITDILFLYNAETL